MTGTWSSALAPGEAWRPNFVCECPNPDCIEMLELSEGEYEAIWASPFRFPVKPGHEYPEVERVW